MNKFFYAKLAFSNLKKNKGLYLPYLITAIGIGAMFYIMMAISGDKGIMEMPGAANLQFILVLGNGIIGIFAVIFLFYTNSFLMKRRKKEFGLFNILGMEKRHIGKMMFWETLIVAFVSILGGIATGIIFNKLVVLALLRITGLEVPFGFHVSVSAIVGMTVLFLCIFGATFLYNQVQVRRTKPVELLQSEKQGETEPKTRWILTVIGILSLVTGYGIAILTRNPMEALVMFFVAVLLVMLGTYCIFTAASVAVLKLMRRNKTYYYKTSHFISVSGMIYRMKQNAVGLSNICILSTMVLVMIAGTVSLNAGFEDVLNNTFPKDIRLKGYSLTEDGRTEAKNLMEQAISESGLAIENMKDYISLEFAAWKNGENIGIVNSDNALTAPEGEITYLMVMTLADYEKSTGDHRELAEDEILVYVAKGNAGDKNYHMNEKTFQIKEYLDGLEMEGLDIRVVYPVYAIVVKDEAVLNEIFEMQKSVYGDHASNVEYNIFADVSGTKEQIIDCTSRINMAFDTYNQNQAETAVLPVSVESKEENRVDLQVLYGGFLFLGVFLGFVFLIAMVMIIYYKQISEGYEDKSRFEIMQKVGMSQTEVKSAIHSQILKVFFLPLVMACMHLAAAFPMMNRLIQMFGMQNMKLFAICSLLTVGVFTLIYIIVYGITARAYYKIVK